MIKRIVFSLLVTLVVSSIVGFIFWPAYGFVRPAVFAFLIQIVIGWAVNSILEQRAAINLEKLANDRIADLAKQSLRLTCPCTKQVQEEVPLRFDKDNFYECSGCNKTVGVRMDVRTALITDMVDVGAQHEEVTRNMQSIVEKNLKSQEKQSELNLDE